MSDIVLGGDLRVQLYHVQQVYGAGGFRRGRWPVRSAGRRRRRDRPGPVIGHDHAVLRIVLLQ